MKGEREIERERDRDRSNIIIPDEDMLIEHLKDSLPPFLFARMIIKQSKVG